MAAAALLRRQAAAAVGARAALRALEALCVPLAASAAGGTRTAAAGVHSCSWSMPAFPLHRQQPTPWRHTQQPPLPQQQRFVPPLLLRLYSADTRHENGSWGKESQQRQQQQQQQPPTPAAAGWPRGELLNVPNLISMLRLLSGPLIASWILDAQWSLAVPALAVSGASDWADGYLARRLNQPSVVGSYLDPLADKVLICSVVAALGWSGTLPVGVVAIVVGRDVVLVGGAFAARARSLGWRWPGWSEFFRVQQLPGVGGGGGLSAAAAQPAAAGEAAGQSGGAASGGAAPPGAPLVRPLLISKVNTVVQLGLVGGCMLHAWLGWPGDAVVDVAVAAAATTTVWSSLAYLRAFRQGRVLVSVAPQQQ